MRLALVLVGSLALASESPGDDAASPGDDAAPRFDVSAAVELSDDACWCWYQDERAVLAGGRLITTAIPSGHTEPARRGRLEALVLDPATGDVSRSVLHPRIGVDDHNVAALLPLGGPGEPVLAVCARHNRDNSFYVAESTAESGYQVWSTPQPIVPSEPSRLTYSNLLLAPSGASAGRVYNFFRGLDNSFRPSFAYSDDRGASWQTGRVLIGGPENVRTRPYVKYAAGQGGAIHLVYTEGHPRNVDNSVYHVVFNDGRLSTSGGDAISTEGGRAIQPAEGTLVYQGAPERVAWTQDLHVDAEGRPVAAFSVQMNSQGLPKGQGGEDLRYGIARWENGRWRSGLIGYAGTRLYPREDDYAGGICLDPQNPRIVYCSADVDPNTNEPTPNGKYELFRGVVSGGGTGDGSGDGQTCRWEPLTPGATTNHYRPMVPLTDGRHTALLWLEGEYTTYTDFRQRAMVSIAPVRSGAKSAPTDR